jgi:hypothetical protein
MKSGAAISVAWSFMGPCQGRLCGLTVTELMAQARGRSPQEIGYYRLRAPVKPITLAELAAVPKTEADVKAVVRGGRRLPGAQRLPSREACGSLAAVP